MLYFPIFPLALLQNFPTRGCLRPFDNWWNKAFGTQPSYSLVLECFHLLKLLCLPAKSLAETREMINMRCLCPHSEPNSHSLLNIFFSRDLLSSYKVLGWCHPHFEMPHHRTCFYRSPIPKEIVMGPGQNFLTPVGSNFLVLVLGRVSSAIFGLSLGLENFPWKSQIFQFFALLVKKISLSRVKKYLDQSQVGLFFTASQKYARVGSGWVKAHLYKESRGRTQGSDQKNQN